LLFWQLPGVIFLNHLVSDPAAGADVDSLLFRPGSDLGIAVCPAGLLAGG
jgi:hypothetical protein